MKEYFLKFVLYEFIEHAIAICVTASLWCYTEEQNLCFVADIFLKL